MGCDKGNPTYLVYYLESQKVNRVRFVMFTSQTDNIHESVAHGRSSTVPDSFHDEILKVLLKVV